MVKKLLVFAFVPAMATLILASCVAPFFAGGESSDLSAEMSGAGSSLAENEEGKGMMEKLYQIKSDWKEQQVFELLGMPDRYGERSVVAEVFYTVDSTREATIAFWREGVQITVTNLETGETATVLG